ncbi:MAG: ADP-ribosylation factor-like protein [Vicinamibacteria bacterium]
MVILDPDSDDVVIRVVYDGPPEAGKTTSVRALAGSLGRPVFTPDQIEGRTVFFDWLDYTGGLFEGHRIRCQVVSVPGQATLAPRRRALLAQADVVVFVADTRREHVPGLPAYLQGLTRILSGLEGPPVGLVVQANKRDLPGAVPVPEVRRMLDQSGVRVGIIESVATDGAGIREAFVFAVRLALDRAREQLRAGRLRSARPPVASGEELLRDLRAAEGGALELASGDRLTHTRLSEVTLAGEALGEALAADEAPTAELGRMWHPEPDRERTPLAPSAAVAGGLIWPPVRGRLTLHEAGAADAVLARGEDGDWHGLAGDGYRLQSPANATYADLDRGRSALIEWARIHSASGTVLSGDRCIALSEDHGRTFRLWQIVRAEPSLAERLDEAPSLSPREIGALLVECAQTFLEAARLVPQAACRLPLTLASIRAFRVGAPYVGLMPAPAFVRPPDPCSAAMAAELLARELAPYLRVLADRREEVTAVLDGLRDDGPAGQASLVVRTLWAGI